ncbi:MAG: hypothetical protein AB1Z98_35590 [Nannocystaceae bacterium]
MLLDLILRLPRRVAWALLVPVAFIACDGSRVGPSPDQLRALIDTHCESVQTCGCEAALTSETCDDDLTARWNQRIREGDARGLRYDAECFAALIDDVERFECYQPGGPTPLCQSFCAVYYGDKQLEEACEATDELVSDCAAGLLCHEGACVEPCTVLGGRQQGEPCADLEGSGNVYDDCAQGLGCQWTTGTCEPLALAGDSCRDTGCAEGLFCSWNEGSGETCRAAATQGQSCLEVECATGLYCEWNNSMPRCRAEAAEGESCSETRCQDQLWCDESNRCVAAPLVDERCLFGSVCAEGLLCNFELDRCDELPLVGERCLQGECGRGAWCMTTMEDPDGTCMAPVEVGQMCSGHRQCASGSCPNGFCWARPSEGEDCTQTQVCAPGLVCNGTICEPTLTRAPAACGYPGW